MGYESLCNYRLPFFLKNRITPPSLKCTGLVLIAINVPAKYNDIIAMHVLKFSFYKASISHNEINPAIFDLDYVQT